MVVELVVLKVVVQVDCSVDSWDDVLVESMVVVKVERMDARVAAGWDYKWVVVMVDELVLSKVVVKVDNSVGSWDVRMVESTEEVKVELMDARVAVGWDYKLVVVMVAEVVGLWVLVRVGHSVDSWVDELVAPKVAGKVELTENP